MSGQNGEPEPTSQASYHESDGRLVLANPWLRVELSATDGTICSLLLRQIDAQLTEADEAAGAGTLWQLDIASPDGGRHTVTNRDCAGFSHTVGRHRHQGALRLWLQWSGFRVGSGVIEAALTAEVSFPDDSAHIVFSEEVELPAGYAVSSLAFPCVHAVGCPDPLEEDGLFLPLSGGVFLPSPGSLAPGGERPTWRADYPGPASLQLFGYSCGERVALWLAAQDQQGARKTLAASRMPSSSRLRLWIEHTPRVRADGHWSAGYSSAIGLVSGDWFEAAREYRLWAAAQPWASAGRRGERILPPLTTAYGLWASYWGGARRCVSAMRELQRMVNAPIKLDWRCWHACARDGAYPDYLPPRDGEDALSAAESQLGDAGVLDQFSINALLASQQSSAWQQHDLSPHALQPSGGASPPALIPAEGRAPAALHMMCPGDPHWRGIIAEVARAVTERGADGVLLEDLGSAAALTCDAANHGHHPPLWEGHSCPDPAQWSCAVRGLLAEVRRAIGAKRQLATDEVNEQYLAAADAFFSPHAGAERQLALRQEFGHRWTPIPLFAAVYHDYTSVIGPAVSLSSPRPHDPAWPASVIAEFREPAHVMQRDYQTQFCLEVARALTWGYEPLLEGFLPEQARDESSRHKLAFLAAALRAQAWGIGALIPQSQFMGPIAVECPAIEADMLVNPPRSTAAERRFRRQSLPSVLASAWRVPGGGLALVLVNINQQAVEFTARLRSARLSPQLPLRMMGRTFSEDGDVPAASLGASGTDITGKLPRRAIVLVSLR
ncbi:MAG: DUF6259 domain-containing protein [Armatimonadota bacterium]